MGLEAGKGLTGAIERIGEFEASPISIGWPAWQLVSRIIPKLADLHTARTRSLFFGFSFGDNREK